MRKTSLALAAVTSSMVLAPVAAFAAWNSAGTGSGTATATSVNRASAPTATRGTGTVALSWNPTTLADGTTPVTGYDLIRHQTNTADEVVCHYADTRTTSCVDRTPVAGPVSYGVVARIGTNWQGAESPTTDFTYDRSAPTTTMTTAPAAPNAAGWFKQDVVVTFTATDPGTPAAGVKEIHFTLNGAETIVEGASASVTVTQEQLNQLTFWAVDNNGNTQSPVNAAVVQLDKTAPVTTISPVSSSSWITTNQVTLSASDATSGVASVIDKVDANSATTYSGPFTLTDGAHTVTYHAVDVAGNVEADKSATIKVDTTKPTATVDPASGTTNSVTILGSDATSGVARVEYQLDGSTTWTTGTAVSWAAGSGTHTLKYRAVDAAGNVGDTATATYTATSALSAPSGVTCSAGSKSANTITISWSAVPGATGYVVTRSPGGTNQVSGLSLTFTGSNNAPGTAYVQAQNSGGLSNQSTSISFTFGNGNNKAPTCD